MKAKKQFYDYQGEKILVRYELGRCIHAGECVKGLPAVFDSNRQPWIDPDQGSVESVADVVMRCPTGALHFESKDDGPDEPKIETNCARLAADGPAYVSGRLLLEMPDGSKREENRVALCRCGASRNKPFCDNSHQEAGFVHAGTVDAEMMAPAERQEGAELLHLKIAPKGPVICQGPLRIESADGQTVQQGGKGALCRCGASQSKPYCDGSHAAIGFEAE